MKKLYIQNGREELTLNDLFEEFLIAKKCLNVSPYTISYYERCFKSFSKYYDVTQPCGLISLNDVNGYILYLKGRDDVNDITINTNLRGLLSHIGSLAIKIPCLMNQAGCFFISRCF